MSRQSGSRADAPIPRAVRLLPLLACLAAAGAASAQDAHQWNQQYGNLAYLLGGAMIGSVENVSAVYYNPARLVLADSGDLEISGSAYRMYQVTLKNALGTGRDLTTTVVGSAPSLVAGTIPVGDQRDRRLAYSVLFRQDFDVVLELRGPVSLPGLLGDATARLNFEENAGEVWSGLSYAQRLGARVGLGASVFATYRTYRSRRSFVTASETIGEYGVALQRDDFDYTQVGVLAKIGLGGNAGDWRWGVTATTPTVRLTGKGSQSYDRILAINDPETNQLLEYLASDTRHDIRADHRTPLALGAGLSYRVGRGRLHFSAEWFEAIDSYELLEAAPEPGEGSGDPAALDQLASSRSVVNWGAGLEYPLSGRLTGYLSYHTDFSTENRVDAGGPLAVWDIHHYAGGLSLNFGSKRFQAGLIYAEGSKDLPGTIDLVPGLLDAIGETSLTQDLEARYRSFMLLVGLNLEY